MKLTRREFMTVGAMLALSGCGGGSKKDDGAVEEAEESEPEPIVDEPTNYDVFRADVKKGLLGDVEGYTSNTMDFSGSYATLQPDGTFNFDIAGVVYNGTISLGDKTKHLYSGQDAEVTRLLFDGKTDTTVGSVLVEGYTVDDYLLIEMTAKIDGEQNFITYYLWESKEE